MTNPVDTPELFHIALLAGVVLPGVATVDGFDRDWDWDKKKPKGASGATATLQGEPLVEGKITLKLWLAEHFAAWAELQPLLERGQTNAKSVEALDLAHPFVNANRVHAVTVEKIGIPKQVKEGDTLYTVAIQLLEYRKPTKAGGTPTGAKAAQNTGPDGKPVDQPTAQSEQDKEIEELLKKAQAA